MISTPARIAFTCSTQAPGTRGHIRDVTHPPVAASHRERGRGHREDNSRRMWRYGRLPVPIRVTTWEGLPNITNGPRVPTTRRKREKK